MDTVLLVAVGVALAVVALLVVRWRRRRSSRSFGKVGRRIDEVETR